ncbi:MAG: ParB/RepB/Spo0J family partition protein [Sphingomonas fennica]
MSGEAIRKRTPGLGRGLSSLLGEIRPVAAADATPDSVRTLPIASIAPHPEQPRRHFDESALDELAESIALRGVLQPIIVRPHGEGYQIIAGERRWRAAQRARLHEIPALVREMAEAETFELALIENIQRQDLNAIEEADAYARLIEQFGHTQEALGKLVQKSRSHVANLLRLRDLPAPVREAVADGSLSMGHARALVTATDPQALAEQVIRQGLSVRDTERLAKGRKSATRVPEQVPAARAMEADIAALERQLADRLGLAVQVTHGGPGGSVTIVYGNLDQLDLVCQRLSGERI